VTVIGGSSKPENYFLPRQLSLLPKSKYVKNKLSSKP